MNDRQRVLDVIHREERIFNAIFYPIYIALGILLMVGLRALIEAATA